MAKQQEKHAGGLVPPLPLSDMHTEKVLIVDDEAIVLDGYSRVLRKQFKLATASSGQEALELLAKDSNYAVVISDMRMPGMDGLELLSRVCEINPDATRIMLTGLPDQQTVIDAINHGAIYKFLTKPCDATVMGAAITDGIQRHRQIKAERDLLNSHASKLKGLSQKLSYQSTHDKLTGLANRYSFAMRLDKALMSAQNEKLTHVVCYLDLDHLHVINDRYGMDVGNELLKEVAEHLKHGRRRDDMVVRMDGDEFAILLYDCDLEQARKIAEQLRRDISDIQIIKDGKTISASASLGLVPITSEDETVATIIHTAEAACALAREQGPNLMHVVDGEDAELKRRLKEVLLVSDINQALKENNFKLYYQTIAPTDPTAHAGQHYELLLRLQDTNGVIHLPEEFLPAAEHYHLTPKIDCWVICNYVAWLANHPEQLEKLSICSINLSGLSLGNDEVLDCILTAFTSNHIPPEKICFEVTETAAILRIDAAMQFITTLKEKGFLFSLDDFGSGYSSFAYLRDLPIDFLKIDGTFVRNMDQDHINRNMVKAIHEIGRLMEIKSIAEFVENKEVERQLQEIRVDYIQGYLISKPRPLDEMK